MEDIFTDSQISQYPLMRLKIRYLVILFFICSHCLVAQHEPNAKAVKLTQKADEAIKERDFYGAIELLKKAINKDDQYGKAYLRLAGIYNLYRKEDSAFIYYDRYVNKVPAQEVDDRIWLRLAEIHYDRGRYQPAKEALDQVKDPPKLLKESIEFSIHSMANEVVLDIQDLPEEINQFQLQYFPVLTVDEQVIFYTKRSNDSPNSDEDIVVSFKINGEWIPAQSLSRDVNTPFNEGACSISADGKTLIFAACEGRPTFGSCDLYITYRQGNKWAVPENLGSKVNSPHWDSQPALSSDGRTLYFSSNRPGGKGARDLWVTRYNGLLWTIPVNLGDSINTERDETTPFIHANNELLFYSSNGMPGLGGYDLYVSERVKKGWGKPRNLGHPINTLYDELSLFVNATGSIAYYAKEQEVSGRLETRIVKFPILADTLVKKKSSYITGRVADAVTKDPIGATFKMVNLDDTTDTYIVRSDSINGQYYLVLTSGKEYSVFITKENYLFEDLRFFAKENTNLKPDTLNLLLHPMVNGQSVTLENIYFDFDDYKLNERSITELQDIVLFINQNPNKRFIIAGHTDNQGNSAYNRILSEKRAKSVYDFLVSHGVSKSSLSFIGYGDTRPAYTNTTEEGKKLNRRITFSVAERK